MIKNVQTVRHEDFLWGNYKIKKSKRFLRPKRIREKKEKIDSIHLTKLLNQNTMFTAKKGRYKKNSIQIYRDDIEIEKDILPLLENKFSIKNIIDMIKRKNVDPLIEFIITNYNIK